MADGDIVTDYDPEFDRLLFPPQDEDPSDDVPPAASFGGDTHLVVTFTTDTSEATLEFEGLPAGTEIPINTSPCDPPPTPFVCAPIYEEPVFVDLFYLDPGLFPLDGILLSGTAADETLVGTDCSDIIAGDGIPEEGDFFEMEMPLDGEFSDDVIDGLAGNDIILGDSFFIFESAIGGDDEIYGGAGVDAISGDSGLLGSCECDDGMSGIGGADTIFGEAGDDAIAGDAFYAMFGASEGGDDPIWSRDGKELFYRNGDKMMAVPISLAGGFQAGKPRLLWEGQYSHGMSSSCGMPGATSANYDVTGDGQRFLMVKDQDQDAISTRIVVVLNFAEELKRLTAAGRSK